MDKLIKSVNLAGEIQMVIGVILGILVLFYSGLGAYLAQVPDCPNSKPEQNPGGPWLHFSCWLL